jgi:hypothetical protein
MHLIGGTMSRQSKYSLEERDQIKENIKRTLLENRPSIKNVQRAFFIDLILVLLLPLPVAIFGYFADNSTLLIIGVVCALIIMYLYFQVIPFSGGRRPGYMAMGITMIKFHRLRELNNDEVKELNKKSIENQRHVHYKDYEISKSLYDGSSSEGKTLKAQGIVYVNRKLFLRLCEENYDIVNDKNSDGSNYVSPKSIFKD